MVLIMYCKLIEEILLCKMTRLRVNATQTQVFLVMHEHKVYKRISLYLHIGEKEQIKLKTADLKLTFLSYASQILLYIYV